MTRVYEIEMDCDTDYASFYLKQNNYPLKLLSFGPLPDDWRVPKLYIDQPRLPIPNFIRLDSGADNFILDGTAMKYTGHIFEMSGQLFPFTYKHVITGEKEKYFFFKPTKCFDCLDEKKSHLDVANWDLRYVFDPARIQVDTPIIAIPQLNSSPLFAIEGIMHQFQELKYCIDKFKLTGLKLTEVWSDGAPPYDDEEYDDSFFGSSAVIEDQHTNQTSKKTKKATSPKEKSSPAKKSKIVKKSAITLSNLKLRVKSFEFDSGVVGCKLPIDAFA